MRGIWSIILAAGESKRMGSPKMFLHINGKTMIENVIENVAGSDPDGILVVLGAFKEDMADLIRKYNVKYCYNENYLDGMLSSVKCGFSHLPQDLSAVLVFQGDQPFIAPAVTKAVIEAYRSTGKGLVMPVCNGRRGHPLLIDKKYVVEIECIDANEGLRSLSYKFPMDVHEVETSDPGILRDFDTYEDYENEIKNNR